MTEDVKSLELHLEELGHAKETELKATKEKRVNLVRDNKVLKTQLEEAKVESLWNFTKGSGWTTIAKRRR